MVSEVALHHAFQPRSDEHDRLMHLPTQLLLDGKELSPQSLHRSAPPDHKMTLRVPTTVVGEPEEREGFRLPLFAFSSIRRREASELDQPRLLRWISKPNLASRSRKSLRNRSASAWC